MPVNTIQKTRWEEQALAKYLLDPATGLPVASRSSPLNVQLPGLDFMGGTSFTLDGSLPKWLTPPTGATVVVIAARGGEIYYSINGVTASANSPGYVADGNVQTIGPVCNMSAMWVYSATAGTFVHVNFYRETGSGLAGAWPVPDYWQRVMATGPIAFWPQWETSGNVAHCLVNPAQNGTYTGVTLANDATGPFGMPAPFYDGANDYLDVISAALIAALDSDEGSFALWVRMANAGVWTDGTNHFGQRFNVLGSDDYISMGKPINNTWRMRYVGNTVLKTVDAAIGVATGDSWFFATTTWSKIADEFKGYINGAQVGLTQTILTMWDEALLAAVIGAYTLVPAFPSHGWLGPAGLWGRALPLATIETLALV